MTHLAFVHDGAEVTHHLVNCLQPTLGRVVDLGNWRTSLELCQGRHVLPLWSLTQGHILRHLTLPRQLP